MILTRKQRKIARRIIQSLLVVVIWQFVFPQHAFAQSVSVEPLNPDVISILPVGESLTPAVPLAQPVAAVLPVVQNKPLKITKTRTVVMTAYSSTRDQTDADPFTTASGQKVRDGIIAMNGVPFGTKVRIPEKFGDKVFVVQDRMNSRYGSSRADIWMKTRNDAKQWGVRRVKVEILK
jgi:3D (Asp-Asp-Asp) domain-containing protein